MERVKKQPHSKPAAVRRIVAMLVLLLFAAAFGGQLVADSVSWQNLPACVQFVPSLLRGIHGSWPAFGVVVLLLSYLGIMMGRRKKEARERRWQLIAVLFLLIFAIKGAFFGE